MKTELNHTNSQLQKTATEEPSHALKSKKYVPKLRELQVGLYVVSKECILILTKKVKREL